MQVLTPTIADSPRTEAEAPVSAPLFGVSSVKDPDCEFPEEIFTCEEGKKKETDIASLSPGCKEDSFDKRLYQQIEKLLDLLLTFEFSSKLPAEDTLRKLIKLYTAILDSISQLSSPQRQHAYLQLLDTYLVHRLDPYSLTFFPSFRSFLHQYGSAEFKQAFRNSFFAKVTGRALSPKEFMTLSEGSERTVIRPDLQKPGNIEGFVYRPQVKNAAAPGVASEFNMKNIVEHDYSIPLNAAGVFRAETQQRTAKSEPFFTLKELQAIETFVRENVSPDTPLSRQGAQKAIAKNNELIGFLSAFTKLKTSVFLNASDMKSSLRVQLSQSADQLIQNYIIRTLGGADSGAPAPHAAAGNTVSRSDYSAVYKIYYYILTLYQKDNDPGAALSNGLSYAYDTFLNKAAEKHALLNEAYLPKHGFFFQDTPDPASDRKKGWTLLKKNWSQFAKSLSATPESSQEIDKSFYSPWGVLVSPLDPSYKPGFKNTILIIGAAAAAILIVMALVF